MFDLGMYTLVPLSQHCILACSCALLNLKLHTSDDA